MVRLFYGGEAAATIQVDEFQVWHIQPGRGAIVSDAEAG